MFYRGSANYLRALSKPVQKQRKQMSRPDASFIDWDKMATNVTKRREVNAANMRQLQLYGVEKEIKTSAQRGQVKCLVPFVTKKHKRNLVSRGFAVDYIDHLDKTRISWRKKLPIDDDKQKWSLWK